MCEPTIARATYNLHPLILVLLLLPALACRAFIPSTPTPLSETSNGTRVDYPTDISTIHFDNKRTVVIDHTGSYCLSFPIQWEVGAFHDDFVPTVKKHCEINAGICSLFEQIHGKDSSLRIFAIDTASGHLTGDNMTVLHIGMFQEEWRLQSTMDDLAAEYAAYVNSSGQLKVMDTFVGKTQFEVPYVILLTEPVSVPEPPAKPAYSGVALLKTDKAYLEVLYTTFDQSINIVDELSPILTSTGMCHE